MICSLYQNLTAVEKWQFLGKLTHAAQSDELCFLLAQELIENAASKGVLDGVVILPNEPNDKPLIA